MAHMYTFFVMFVGAVLLVIVFARSWWPTSPVKADLVKGKVMRLLTEKEEMTEQELKEAFQSGFPKAEWPEIADALEWFGSRWTGYKVGSHMVDVPGTDQQIRTYYVCESWPDLPTTLLPYD